MKKIIIGTVIIVCALGIGYYFHWKRKTKHDTLETLRLSDIFTWIDECMEKFPKDSLSKYEVNILPNQDTQKLLKTNDSMAYAAILNKKTDTNSSVISTKIFYAKSIDVDLESLNKGIIVVIPIE